MIETPGWQPLPPVAGLLRTGVGTAIGAIVSLLVVPVILNRAPGGVARVGFIVGAVLFGALVGGLAGRASWRHTRWKLDGQAFHVRRGWLQRTEVLVPRSRVQHLDLERGPLERRVGLATLVIHTAGSQTPALRQWGLDQADAVSLRDALIPAAVDHDDAL